MKRLLLSIKVQEIDNGYIVTLWNENDVKQRELSCSTLKVVKERIEDWVEFIQKENPDLT